nr:uncharacterized protein LOC113711301 [Coffea arabica]
MAPAKKAEFLRSLREARVEKKKQKLFLSLIQKVPPACVESAVCFSYGHDRPSGSDDQTRVVSSALENRECLVPVDSVVTGGGELRCIPSDVSNFLDDHASSSSKKKTSSRSAPSLNKGGEISVVAPPMPCDLKRLFIGSDEESFHFRNNAHTYNNNLGFTPFATKYDSELTKNTKGVYTFRVQGQVYYFLNGLVQSDDRASGIQLYFFDIDEELAKRIATSNKLRESILRLLMRILSDNPYAKFFRNLRHRVYNLPSASLVAAIWTENQGESGHKGTHIQVYTHSNSSYRIRHYYGCYDPLQYPILFPCGECGWHPGIKRVRKRKRREDSCEKDIDIHPSSVDSVSGLMDREQRAVDRAKNEEDTVLAREYYCYRFQIKDDDESMLLHSLRLLQQYAVDGYVKIETSRLDFHRNRQKNIRSEVLQGVLDSISIGQTNASKVRTILPTSFIGGPRDMRRRYLDAMSFVQKYGKPDIFLTMTCNPAWKEIQDNLKYHEKPQDRPDLLARVFRAKFELLKSEVLTKQIFGEVATCVYSHDRVVYAKIPDRSKHPHLYSLVVKHMIHGPCGDMDRTCPCVKDGHCKNRYPKSFCTQTTENSYPQYRRWDDEICSIVKLVKYMYKYVFKGHDSISFKIVSHHAPDDTDEIKDFQQGRRILPLRTNVVAQNLKCLYKDFPRFFVWSPKYKKWTKRKRRKVIGGMVTVSPADGERYYLRLFLNHVHGPTSFDDILTVVNQKLNSFREAALALGLLQSDTYIEDTLQEAMTFQMPSSLRLLFATLLVHCSPVNPRLLWEKFRHELSTDYQ